MATLASIIKEVDKDGLKGQWKDWVLLQGTQAGLSPQVTVSLCPPEGSSDEDFAAALYHFNHSLVTSDLQSPNLQVGVHCGYPEGVRSTVPGVWWLSSLKGILSLLSAGQSCAPVSVFPYAEVRVSGRKRYPFPQVIKIKGRTEINSQCFSE